MKKSLKRFGLIGFWIFILGSVFIAFLTWNFWNKPGVTVTQNAILGVTGLAVIWYSLVSMEIANLTRLKIEIESRPAMILLNPPPDLLVQNVGAVSAINITVDDIQRGNLIFKFVEKSCCLPHETKAMPVVKVIKDGKEIIGSGEADQLKNALVCDGSDSYEVVVRYKDVDGVEWMGKSTITARGIVYLDNCRNMSSMR